MFRGLSSFYVSPVESLRGVKVSGLLWWDVMLSADTIAFYCTVPADWVREITSHIENTWPGASVEKTNVYETSVPECSDICEMKCRRHNIFSLQTDRRIEYEPLRSILSVTSDMAEGDISRLSIAVQPISRFDWQDHAERKFDVFKKGTTPRRTKLSKRDIFIGIGEFVSGLLQSGLDVIHAATGSDVSKKRDDPDQEKRLLMIDGQLSRGTLNKRISPTFNTYIRIASASSDPARQSVNLRSIAHAFNELTADNELERADVSNRLKPVIIRELNTFKLSWLTRFDPDKNVMSNDELGRLADLPTAALQDEFSERLDTLNSRQIEVPAVMTDARRGLYFGDVPYKRKDVPVYIPTGNKDRLCLPTVVIGGMGSGKTKGFACNRAVGFVERGYSAIIVDPAKSEVWPQIKKSVKPEKRRRILLGRDVISLDFREALRTESGRSRLAQILLTLCDDNTDAAGVQTQRYLRASVMAMQSGKLSEIVRIFTESEYRKSVIQSMSDGMHRQTLAEFDSYRPDRQRQILAPIMNRLDVILGDPYLERCMSADNGLDFVDILSERGACTVIDVPDRLNTRLAKDVLINLISFKIDAAMTLRKDEFPFAIIYDEPHQYLRSARLWEYVAVEARKYRLSYSWLFHSWEQIPRQLAQIIRDAGPHYVLYQSSKRTYRDLAEEIEPFTVEDGLRTPAYHAICAMRYDNKRTSPVMVRMAKPT